MDTRVRGYDAGVVRGEATAMAGWTLLKAEFARQAERAFLWRVVAFAAGIVLFFTWRVDPPAWAFVVPGVLGAAIFPLRRQIPAMRLLAVPLIAFGLGHGAAQLRTAMVATPLLERETRAFMLEALVQDAEKRPEGNRIVVTNFTVPGITAAATPQRLRLTLPAAHGIPAVGTRIKVRAVARPAAVPVIPDGFQFQRFLYFAGIGGVGYSVGRWQPDETQPRLGPRARFHAWAEALRRAIGDRIAEIIPGADGAVAGALVNGEQSAIPEDLQEAYRVSGIAHLLSISGVHMSLLAGMVFFIIRRMLALVPPLALRLDTKKAAAWVSLAATAFYLVISGMSVPAVRSFLMIAVVMAAILLDRTALSLRTVAWAALVLMALFPEAVVGASFQMSFLAVLAMVALYEQAWVKIAWRGADGRFLILRAAGLYLAGLIVTDIVAGGATSLFAAYHFNRLPTYSVVTNFLAVPLTGLWIMPWAMLGLVFMPLGWDAIPFRMMGEGVALLDTIARTVAAWPAAQIHVPPMQVEVMALGALGVVFVCLWKGRLRWLGFAAVLPAILQPIVTPAPDLLVDDSARVFAVSDESGHLVTRPGRAGRFVREVWEDRYGASEQKWPAPGETDAVLGLSCDADGCILARRGRTVLLAFTPTALAEDCGAADMTVSATAGHDLCRRAGLVDIIDLRRDGAAAFWFTATGIRTRSVRESTGDRVWMRGVENSPEGEPEN